ncbi:neutral/alkaline non-lysosomal ceramidase N-terminal domain-containing protein [Nevskia soli]|uniref:neutral/alkaline non-lysosomal ceramidase N-terminal domain-containing protein n=1 Tax=Nevskia soli TaxID=418856 RepID=UPI0004A6EEB8|nr:neutral/alkaline non-lysosomal ceramidase N-terminal domain-containing protein [Nevskia soli]
MSDWMVGAARREIRFPGYGFGMMGYGRATQVIRGHATPLYSRAFCIADGADGAPLFFAQSEICMIFPELKRAVLKRLGESHPGLFSEERLMLTASHTHSAPGGFSHFPFYNFSIPGFRPKVFDGIVRSLYEALTRAHERRQPATLHFTHGDFAEESGVAFNRSLAAYNRNPGVTPLPDTQTHLALERTMWLLHARTPDGRAIGQINWFGVHPTSLGNTGHLVSYDNKGYAAEYLEKAMGPGTVAIFAQQFAGDVSPNAQGSSRKDWRRGPYRDETANAQFNGRLQSDQAAALLATLGEQHRLRPGATDAALVRRDLSSVEVDSAYTGGVAGEKTSAPCHGLPFFRGSPVDGPGAPAPVIALLRTLALAARRAELKHAKRAGGAVLEAVLAKQRAQQPKLIVSEAAEGTLLGLRSTLRLPAFLDPILKEVQRQERAGALAEKPWVPSVLPLQYFRLGELALIGFPGEITTVAGRELRELCATVLAPAGVRQVVISSYANSYFGYCTTYHEYQAQLYEGGHTTFGNRTHDAFRTEYARFLGECLKPAAERRLESASEHRFSPELLALRSVA